jgi:taurine dioxygenase
VDVVRCSDHIGSEIRGLDLGDPIDPDTAAALRRLLDEHHLLVFRDQALDADDQVRIAGLFGEVVDEAGDGRHHVYLSNARDDGVLAHGRPLLFHADNVFTPEPLSVISLAMVRLDGSNAPTRFADAERAARLLGTIQRESLVGARALNLSGFAGGSYRYRDAEVAPHHPRAAHPVVATNPRTGRPVLLVSEQQTDRIIGWDPDRSESTLQDLFALLYAPDNVYVHEWRVGDLCIWDNLALQHGRPAIGPGERTLRRVAAVVSGAHTQRAWSAVSLAAEVAERADDAV